MLTLIPSVNRPSIADHPSRVPGTLIMTFGRATAAHRRRASATVPAVSRASVGDTSSEMNPSAPCDAS